MSATFKKITLTAFTALDYNCTVEVVGEPSQEVLETLASVIYENVDGCMYEENDFYWERGPGEIGEVEPDSPAPSFKATWTGEGWKLEEL